MLDVNKITPALMICNEEYWIHYVLRDILAIFPHVLVLDTGSTDRTVEIVKETVKRVSRPIDATFQLRHEDWKENAEAIGDGRNLLRESVNTEWMFLIDGDEIWTMPQIQQLLLTRIPENVRVCMAGSHNVEEVNNSLMFRTNDIANKDVLFAEDVRWTRVDYPFEGYDLPNMVNVEKSVKYMPADKVYCYHMRHTRRSSHKAYFRDEKFGYFPYDGAYHTFDFKLLDKPLLSFSNPYIL